MDSFMKKYFYGFLTLFFLSVVALCVILILSGCSNSRYIDTDLLKKETVPNGKEFHILLFKGPNYVYLRNKRMPVTLEISLRS